MAEFPIPATEQDFHANFAQLKPRMNNTEALYESSRCLFCFDAPCIKACPTGIDIPQFIRQINSGNVTGAAKTIYEANYFGNACGKVCPTEVLCEGACVYNLQDVKPIEIGRLQSFATRQVMDSNQHLFKPGKPNGRKVAIIGAGPAGISCACELRALGFEADVFEAKAQPSGLTVYGVAPYKITNEEVLAEMDYLQAQFGYRVHYHSPITTRQELQALEEAYDAIFLGIGLGGTNSLHLPGEDRQNCVGAVEFIEQLRQHHHRVAVGRKVIVLGGGNTAMDAASESARLGAEDVLLAYRRGKDEMGAYDFEYDLANSVGVKGLFNVAPIEIVGNGRVEGVRFVRTQTLDGQVQVVAGTEFVESCDMVIKATGQAKQVSFLRHIPGLELDRNGRIVADAYSGQTTNPQYFASGDARNGGAEVVNAAAEAKVAARGIHAYLLGQ
ncbi:glutamate synthase (NADPH/NADH) small chain [Hymenobacter gelipurpurascens]|uniref:Glutamate synthase (NADPH/NADH) small chain n=1 Tax=Hymenobacter gelipurpurascens TaxID=89968 RepID=A0A212UHS8_9BACT|nr:FAD-dependent oxidoreductase [Hymenobacter gelipurpurascens]SNC77720.1 glutamate synthase (NADPH/NADH) small chain [Hymenobacter gelipurpurascens]